METGNSYQELICITCPRGCRLRVEREMSGELRVSGNACRRGIAYANAELNDPRRMIASTVRAIHGVHPVVPVATERPIPKAKIRDVMTQLRSVAVTAPVRIGDVILKDAAGTGVDVLASRDLAAD